MSTIVYSGNFNDKATYDKSGKTAISVRDGVLEYLGSELGIEPADKTFKVWRSPATISNTAMKMQGIPLTKNHVTLDESAPNDGGMVKTAEMVDVADDSIVATIAIKNNLDISDSMLEFIDAGGRELSLGYRADLIEHDTYDFEQTNIEPHHLAAVERGRCGSMCSFLDKKINKEQNMDKNKDATSVFHDAEGAISLERIVEIAQAIPEAIKNVPVDQLGELIPTLEAIVGGAKPAVESTDEEVEEEIEATDESKEEADDEETKEKDEKEFSDAVSVKAKEFVDAAIAQHSSVIDKAREFVDEGYTFADKDTNQIMRDALATQGTDTFTDAELPVAFKLLKQNKQYKDFAAETGSLADLGDKEL